MWSNCDAGIAAVTRVCTMRVDLSHISHARFKRKINSRGISYYCINFAERMTLVDEVESYIFF